MRRASEGPRLPGCGAVIAFGVGAAVCGVASTILLDVPLNVAATVGLGIVGLLATLWTQGGALRRRRATQRALADDPRPPVLLLRSFERDDEPLGRRQGMAQRFDANNPFLQSARVGHVAFDDYLAPALTARVGPAVALQNRHRKWFSTEIADLLVEDDLWRLALVALLRDAGCVLIFPGGSAGLAWELGQLRRLCEPGNVLVACRPDGGDVPPWPAFAAECRGAGLEVDDEPPAPGSLLGLDAAWRAVQLHSEDDRGPWLDDSLEVMRRTRGLSVAPLARSMVLVDREGARAIAQGQSNPVDGLQDVGPRVRDAVRQFIRVDVAIVLAALGDRDAAAVLGELAGREELTAEHLGSDPLGTPGFAPEAFTLHPRPAQQHTPPARPRIPGACAVGVDLDDVVLSHGGTVAAWSGEVPVPTNNVPTSGRPGYTGRHVCQVVGSDPARPRRTPPGQGPRPV